MITDQELQSIEEKLIRISAFPWKCEKSVAGEWWITSPDDSDHQYSSEYEPIFESSGTIPQLGVDGQFIAESPEIVLHLIVEIRRLHKNVAEYVDVIHGGRSSKLQEMDLTDLGIPPANKQMKPTC